ncbi:unnamed protein product [Rangifer tarandus platyrhynchus]|uniref:Secreted protein n=2 Tax=Rangifer tarandus platyrhynchus TaxID=3082113 RepID=A0ABN8YHE8_RANTA|nr:unnamed protein product [Rangifer tarandus platyrhynchus]CAI9698817.1 unnamed protein product [Rangifer tarandus platyrhynchus]
MQGRHTGVLNSPPCPPARRASGWRRLQVSFLACWVVRAGERSEEAWPPKKGLPARRDTSMSRPVLTDSFTDTGCCRGAANADGQDGCLETCCKTAQYRSCLAVHEAQAVVRIECDSRQFSP